jgi:hypothetical protein
LSLYRLSETSLDEGEKRNIAEIFYGLHKENLASVIRTYALEHNLLQITTFSRLLTEGGRQRLCQDLGLAPNDVQMITLQQINTEEQLAKRVGHFFDACAEKEKNQRVLIVQGQVTPETPASLVECVRYSILNQMQQQHMTSQLCVALVLQVPRYHGGFFAGFPGTRWTAFHIDELCGDQHDLNIQGWAERSLHQVLEGEEGAFLQKLVAEATPKAVSVAFKDDKEAAGRIPSVMEILTTILAGRGEQVRLAQTTWRHAVVRTLRYLFRGKNVPI